MKLFPTNTNTKQPSGRRTGKVAVMVTAVALAIGLSAGVASAGSGSLVVNTNGSRAGQLDYNVHTVTGYFDGTVWDTKSDGLCARAYGATYWGFGTWNSWTYLGQACGVGNGVGFSKYINSGYVGGTRVSVCAGMPNSSRSNCTNRTTS